MLEVIGAFVLGVVVTTIAISESIQRLSPRARLRRRLRHARIYQIPRFPDASEGTVIGTLTTVAQSALRAPASNASCLAYEVVIETKLDDGGSEWAVAHREARVATCGIDDGLGTAVIEATGDVVLFIEGHVVYQAAEPVRRTMESLASPENIDDRLLVRVREAVAQEGERVAATGVGEWRATPEPRSYRETVRRLVLGPEGSRVPLLIERR
jgi:hypothetical protein